MNWYIVQAYSGFEKKVVESIKDELKRHKLDSNLDQLLIPTHQVTEVKKVLVHSVSAERARVSPVGFLRS